MKVTVDIAPLISNPEKIATEQIEILQRYAGLAPWCSAFKIILARGYRNQVSHLQDKYLRLAATYIGDNETLLEYMTAVEPVVQRNTSVDQTEWPSVNKKINSNKDLDSKTKSEKASDNEIASKHDEMLLIKNKDTNQRQDANTKIHLNKISNVNNIDEEKTSAGGVQNPVPKKIISLEIQNKKSTKIDFDTVVTYDPLIELKPNKRHSPKNEHASIHLVAYNPEEELTRLIKEKEAQQDHNFLFWINNLDEEKTKTTVGTGSPDHVQNLLDQFMATKRSRPLRTAEFFKAETKAEESEVDKMEVVSETLCALYEKQGYIFKAIEGYQKLSLQNPDKSAYFAALIRKIETKDNN